MLYTPSALTTIRRNLVPAQCMDLLRVSVVTYRILSLSLRAEGVSYLIVVVFWEYAASAAYESLFDFVNYALTSAHWRDL